MLGTALALSAAIATAPANYTAITGATLIDVSHGGRTSADVRNAVVLIRGDRIVAAGPPGRFRLPPHTRIIPARGRYLIPGLIDGFGALRTQGFADAYLYEGVTTVYVPLAPPAGGLDGETEVAAPANGLSLLTGAPISGYSASGAVPQAHPWTEHRLKDRRLSKSELVAAVDAAAAAGRRALTVGFDVWPEQLDAIVAEAHRRGLAVTAELAFTGYEDAARAGVDVFIRNDKYSLALSPPQDFAAYADDPIGLGGRAATRSVCVGGPQIEAALAAFGRMLRESRTALMPMLSMEATADELGPPNPWSLPSAAFVTPAQMDDPIDPKTGASPYLASHPDRREQLQTCARRKQAIDRELHARGVLYLAGSSTPGFAVMPGGGLHEELRLLQQIGLRPREALAAATGNFAEVYRWTDRGALQAGRRADLVILSADPRADIAAVDAISQVVVAGRVVDREGLLQAARQPHP